MPELPRILIFGKLPPPLMGPALATQRILASELKERFELLHFDTRLNAEVKEMGQFRLSKITKMIGRYKRLSQALKDHRPRVALIPISQTTMGFLKDLPMILICHRHACAPIVQLRGSDLKNWLDGASSLTRWLFSYGMKRSKAAIVLGECLRYLFEPYFEKENIHVVPNGGDYQFPSPRPKDGVQLLSIANHLPGKGLLQVLRAINELDEQIDVRFTAFGSFDNAEYRAECLKEAGRSKGRAQVRGPLSGEAKWQALADADAYIFCPTAPEGHPWSVVEAMAAGKAIISSDQGAIRESVIDSENGFLVRPKQTSELRNKIERLVVDEELRREMGRKSHQFHAARFTEKTMIMRLGKVFDQYLDYSTP